MKRKILGAIFICFITFSLVGCQSNNTKETEISTFEKEREPIQDDSTEISSGAIAVEEAPSIYNDEVLLSGTKEEVFNIIKNFKWVTAGARSTPELYFDDFIARLSEISQGNAFAQEIINKSENIKYNELDDLSQMVFSAYIKYMFLEDASNFVVINESLGEIVEAWYGYDEERNRTHFYLKFENYPKENDTYLYIRRRDKDNAWQWWSNSEVVDGGLNTESNRAIYDKEDGSLRFELQDIGVSNLNMILSSNQEFIDYLIEYRDHYYSPLRNEKLAELESEITEEKQKREEEEKWENMIPQVGMTSDEVKKTSWGEPDKINKDTYEWGVKEQWVYEKKGYVYFEDGKVTSVSER